MRPSGVFAAVCFGLAVYAAVGLAVWALVRVAG